VTRPRVVARGQQSHGLQRCMRAHEDSDGDDFSRFCRSSDDLSIGCWWLLGGEARKIFWGGLKVLSKSCQYEKNYLVKKKLHLVRGI
jgi:hypothetical protein